MPSRSLVGGFVALAAGTAAIVMTAVPAHAACAPPQYCGPPVVVPVSRTHDDQWASGGADAITSMSTDGRFVAFSTRGRLLPADTNDRQDVYRRDMVSNTLELVSRRADGGQADDISIAPSISADGRYVAFISYASNLTAPFAFKGAPHTKGMFRKDLLTGAVVKVDLRSDGGAGGAYLPMDILYDPFLSISANGRFVAFYTTQTGLAGADTPNPSEVYRKDLATGALARVSVQQNGGFGNGSSWHPSISNDGRYVAFSSHASNFVADTNGQADVFRKDMTTGEVVRVSVAADGSELGENLYPSMSKDGRFVSFTAHFNDQSNEGFVDRKDLLTGELVTISSTQGGEPQPGIQGRSAISADGAIVAFESGVPALVPGDTNDKQDVYVKRVSTGAIKRVSRMANGQQAPKGGAIPSISPDGTQVAFWTPSSLWASDTTWYDVYRTNQPLSL